MVSIPLISVVSPVYRAERIIPILVDRIIKAISTVTDNFEIILVEDCGPDQSWSVIESVAQTDERIKGIKLSRNFGQHQAIACGLSHCKGEWIVVMDCDLQDRPEEIPLLLEHAKKQGSQIVWAVRNNRQDGFFKKQYSFVYKKALGYLTGEKIDHRIASFGIFHHDVIQGVLMFSEIGLTFGQKVRWLGFQSSKLDVIHDSRYEGKSTYNFSKAFGMALDLAISKSDKPLKVIIRLGFFISSLSVLVGFYYILKFLMGGIKLETGFLSLILSIWFLSGVIIFILGILGLYLQRVFALTKQRPLFVESKKINI
jgi:glycosyltransferase involved in cell wall biosynthesis